MGSSESEKSGDIDMIAGKLHVSKPEGTPEAGTIRLAAWKLCSTSR